MVPKAYIKGCPSLQWSREYSTSNLVDFPPDNNWPVTYIESLQLVWAFYRSADYLGSYYGVPIAVFLRGFSIRNVLQVYH